MKLNKPLVITAGEPAGIGPKLCSSLVNTNLLNEIVVIGDASLLDDKLKVIDTPFPAPVKAGCPDPRNAKTLLEGLEIAVKGCLSNKFSGMVTAPIAKNVIADAGISFTGHTEFLANLTNILYQSNLTDTATATKLFRSSFIKKINLQRNGFNLDFELVCRTLRMQGKIQEFPITYSPRTKLEGKKIKLLRDGFSSILTVIIDGFIPLRFLKK